MFADMENSDSGTLTSLLMNMEESGVALGGLAAISLDMGLVASRRDYARLMPALLRVMRLLYEDNVPLRDALADVWEDLATAFTADKGLLLAGDLAINEKNVAGEEPFKFTVVAKKNVSDEQITALRYARLVEGVSRKLLYATMLPPHQARIMQHPMLLAPSQRTNAFDRKSGGGAANYSALCAPIMDPTHVKIEAIIYLLNVGADMTRMYREADLRMLLGLTELLEFLNAQYHVAVALVPLETLEEATAKFERRAINARIKYHGGRYTKAAKTLGMKRTAFYHRLNELGVPLSRETRMIGQLTANGRDEDETEEDED